jgi:hypothetical protein
MHTANSPSHKDERRRVLINFAYSGELVGIGLFRRLKALPTERERYEQWGLLERLEMDTLEAIREIAARYGAVPEAEEPLLARGAALADNLAQSGDFWGDLEDPIAEALSSFEELRGLLECEDDLRACDELLSHEKALLELVRLRRAAVPVPDQVALDPILKHNERYPSAVQLPS